MPCKSRSDRVCRWRFELTSYHILEATQDSSEAQLVLQQAQHYLEMQAAQIEDPQLRHSYLTQIQENREIQALTG